MPKIYIHKRIHIYLSHPVIYIISLTNVYLHKHINMEIFVYKKQRHISRNAHIYLSTDIYPSRSLSIHMQYTLCINIVISMFISQCAHIHNSYVHECLFMHTDTYINLLIVIYLQLPIETQIYPSVDSHISLLTYIQIYICAYLDITDGSINTFVSLYSYINIVRVCVCMCERAFVCIHPRFQLKIF